MLRGEVALDLHGRALLGSQCGAGRGYVEDREQGCSCYSLDGGIELEAPVEQSLGWAIETGELVPPWREVLSVYRLADVHRSNRTIVSVGGRLCLETISMETAT